MKLLAIPLAIGVGVAVAAKPADNAPVEPSPEVVQEIVKIQQQLGGSIVVGPDLEPLALESASSVSPAAAPHVVTTLREVAWQLDNSAYQLEQVDLYQQADDLRGRARQFRSQARELKARAGQAD